MTTTAPPDIAIERFGPFLKKKINKKIDNLFVKTELGIVKMTFAGESI